LVRFLIVTLAIRYPFTPPAVRPRTM